MSAERARIAEIVADASRRLAAAGVDMARLDAEVLLAEAAGVSRVEVVAGTFSPSAEALGKFESMIVRRVAREPLAYIVGHKEFFSLDFEVTPAVLIPRPETEFVVTAALEAIAHKPNARILDIGTGSGAIAITIAANAPGAVVTGVDISESALKVARRNADRFGIADRVRLVRADVYDVAGQELQLGIFDVIVSNPPYVSSGRVAHLAPEIREHEPPEALSDSGDGLGFYRRIAAGARAHLVDDGELIVEVGQGQESAILAILDSAGFRNATMINDLAGIPRVIRAAISRA